MSRGDKFRMSEMTYTETCENVPKRDVKAAFYCENVSHRHFPAAFDPRNRSHSSRTAISYHTNRMAENVHRPPSKKQKRVLDAAAAVQQEAVAAYDAVSTVIVQFQSKDGDAQVPTNL